MMVGDNRNRWTPPQLKLLEEMHAEGRQWPEIATAVDHPLNSCQQMLSRIRGAKRNAEFERARMARPAPPGRPNKAWWLSSQLALLEQLADAKTPWDEIAHRVGHPKNSCATKMSEIRSKRDRTSEKPKKRGRPGTIQSPQLAPAPVPDPPSARAVSNALLVADAELRARIAVLGATGGLLGDPMPGRSALDRMRAGVSDPPIATQDQRPLPKITLAAGFSDE